VLSGSPEAHPMTELVNPRRPGDPEPDLTGFELTHRAMRSGTRIAAAAAADPGTGDRPRAIAWFTGHVLAEISAHHHKEDDVLWPVIAASAAGRVDLSALTSDHVALEAVLVRADAALDRFRADPAAGGELAAVLTEIADELDEHIADEEVSMFPAIERYLTVEEWAAVEKRARDGGLPMGFVLPRIIDATRPDELATLKREAGPVLMVLAALVGPGYRRRERLVFG
jgi:hypothetical protein